MLHFTAQFGYNKEKKKGGGNMATRSANVNVRVEPDVKKQAEDILDKYDIQAGDYEKGDSFFG